jgi:hypothetical protein
MERPRLSRVIAKVVWGSDIRPYYVSMAAVTEAPSGGTIVDCPCGAGPALRACAVSRILPPSPRRLASSSQAVGSSALQMTRWLDETGFANPRIQRSGPMLFFDAQPA